MQYPIFIVEKLLTHHDQFKTTASCALWYEGILKSDNKEAALEASNFEIKFTYQGDEYKYLSVIKDAGKKYPFYRGYFFKNGFLKNEKIFRDLLS